ncbi:MAG: PilW family protein [Verrucomicrobiota bacterium]
MNAAAQCSARKRGFTLVELIVSMTLSGVILASITSTFMAFAIGSKSIGAYTEMSSQSRKTLELFSRDIRAADDVTSASKTRVVVTMPDNDFYAGESIEYVFDDLVGIFSRIEREEDGTVVSNSVLLDGVERFAFCYYDPLGSLLAYGSPSLLLSIKSVQIDSELLRDISTTDATDYIISARFMMRNRPVTQ